MKKYSRFIITLFTLIGAILGLAVSFALDKILFSEAEAIPAAVSVGIFFALPAFFSALGALLSFLAAPIIHVDRDRVFKQCIILMFVISLPAAFLLSAGMQKIYEISLGSGGKTTVMIIDRSTSMDGVRYTRSVEAAKNMVDLLSEKDKTGLIFFNEGFDIEQQLTYVDENVKNTLINILDESRVSGTTNFPPALDAAVNMFKEEECEDAGIFVITDAEGIGTVGEETRTWIENNASLFVLSIAEFSGEDNLEQLCENSGGMFVKSSDPEEIKNLYMAMFNNYYNTKPMLNHLRTEGSMPKIFYVVVSALFFILLGVLMTVVYSIMYNNKQLLFKWNIIMGVIAAVCVELLNLCTEADILLLAPFFIIYPAVYLGHIPENIVPPEKKNETVKEANMWVFEQGHIIK